MSKEYISFVVAKAIFKQEGQFTVNDIFNVVRNALSDAYDSNEDLISYIRKKMDSMCADGLISGTDTYYFQYD